MPLANWDCTGDLNQLNQCVYIDCSYQSQVFENKGTVLSHGLSSIFPPAVIPVAPLSTGVGIREAECILGTTLSCPAIQSKQATKMLIRKVNGEARKLSSFRPAALVLTFRSDWRGLSKVFIPVKQTAQYELVHNCLSIKRWFSPPTNLLVSTWLANTFINVNLRGSLEHHVSQPGIMLWYKLSWHGDFFIVA